MTPGSSSSRTWLIGASANVPSPPARSPCAGAGGSPARTTQSSGANSTRAFRVGSNSFSAKGRPSSLPVGPVLLRLQLAHAPHQLLVHGELALLLRLAVLALEVPQRAST